jgi:hypothetical protein
MYLYRVTKVIEVEAIDGVEAAINAAYSPEVNDWSNAKIERIEAQNICDAFHGGGEDWECIDVFRRIESRLYSSLDNSELTSSEENSYYDALSIIRRLRFACEFGNAPFSN